MDQESETGLTGLYASGSHRTEFSVLASAVLSSKATMGGICLQAPSGY